MAKGETYVLQPGDEVSLLANDFWYRFAGKTSESSQSAANGTQKRSQEEREKAEGAAGVTVNNGESTGAQSPQKKHKMLIEQEDEEEKAAPAQKPICFYGVNCTRKNPEHWNKHNHPPDAKPPIAKSLPTPVPPPPETAKPKADLKRKRSDEEPQQSKAEPAVKLAREGSPTPSTIASSSLRSKDRSPTLYTLAFPSFSTATYMFDVHKAAPVACRVISEFLRAHPDLPIRLVLVDLYQSETLELFRKNYTLKDPRFMIVAGDLLNLKAKGITAQYIANATNTTFTGGGSGINKALHDAVPELEALTRSLYKPPAEVGQAYPVAVPKHYPLHRVQQVEYIIHVLGPNMNPNRPNCLNGNYAKGTKLLARAYRSLLCTFLRLTGLSDEFSSSPVPSPPSSPSRPSTFARDPSPKPSSGGEGKTEQNAFKILMSAKPSHAKPPPTAAPKFASGPRVGAWSDVLTPYILHPEAHKEAIYYRDEDVTVIYDKYPKAKYHLLVMPSRLVPGFSSLTSDDVPMIEKMIAAANRIVDELRCKDPKLDFRIGFHAVPSLKQVHMHVISQDFDSPSLKTKKHWNSFTSAFFVDAHTFLDKLKKEGAIKFDKEKYGVILKADLKCHRCAKILSTMPQLKEHILSCKGDR